MTPPERPRSRLSKERIQQVKDLLAKEGLESVSSAIPRRTDAGPAPLSFAQERLWFLCRMRPDSPVFHIPAAYRLRGSMDNAIFERALAKLSARHEALRTRITHDGTRPVQEVLPEVELPFELDPLDGIPTSDRSEEALRRARSAARKPFDLEVAPLARFHAFRVSEDEHILLITTHHIVSEVQSVGVLARDLAALYAGEAGANEASLPELTVSFADYATWQRERAAGDLHDEHLKYWQEELSGDLPTLELPTDHARPAAQSFAGQTRTRILPTELADQLTRYAGETKQTLFAPLLTAYAALLARYSSAQDLLIGIPMTDRDRSELDGLVGFFVNTLVLRCRIDATTSFADLAQRTASGLLDARSHQELPFERLVEALAPDRDLSRSPLFQVAFLLQYETEAGSQALSLGPRLEMQPLDPLAVHTETSKFDLALIAFVEKNGLRIAFEYNADLFEPTTVDRMLEHVERLLEEGLAAPRDPLARLPILTAKEKTLLFEEWNATDAPLAAGTLVHRLFEESAARDPKALAVAHHGSQLTYGEVDERANQLARQLQGLGVGPDTPVGICTERYPEMVVGILATLKAGGAYLPLDLSYPADRLAFMLRDAGAPVVLSRTDLRELVPDHDGTTLFLDDPETVSLLASQPKTPPASEATADNLAYVIYTSGSTGQPKGVGVEHTGLLNLLTWHRRAYDVQPSDRATHLAGLAFDASVWELWPYLTAGASLHLVPDDVRLSPSRIYGWFAEHGITISFLATPLAEAVLREPVPEGLKLRYLLTGGDKLRTAPPAPLPFTLVNHYGPTENSVVATCCDVDPGGGTPPIGHPIDNVRVHLLDPHGGYVPIGVPGELHIAGKSLARGYRGRPELTAEKFLADPQGREERLYATGDLARWRLEADGSGQIEFLGRLDGQVKVRGFRIELGEIEALLGAHGSVRECACALHSREDGEGWLAGYVVVESEVDDATLRGHLHEKLPDYMCPSVFVRMDALPLTPNGKIDRRALPVPDLTETAREFVAPEGELQTEIASVWSEILQKTGIDAHANFFDVGGHSLLMAQVHVRLQERLGRELTIVELFQYPTVSALAAHLESAGNGQDVAGEGLDRAASRLARMKRRRSRKVEG